MPRHCGVREDKLSLLAEQLEKNFWMPEMLTLIELYHLIKIAGSASRACPDVGALIGFPCESTGHNPTGTSSVHPAMNSVECLLSGCRTDAHSLCTGLLRSQAALHIFPTINMRITMLVHFCLLLSAV